MPGHEAGQLADRVALGLVAQRAAKQRERALVEEAREWIEPLPGEARAKLRREVGRVGKSGDLDLILDVEKRLLSDELEHEVAAPGQATALENSMRDLDIAADLVRKVRDPKLYAAVVADHRRDRNRDRSGAPSTRRASSSSRTSTD